MNTEPTSVSPKVEEQINSKIELDAVGPSQQTRRLPRVHSLDAVRAIAMLIGLPGHAALTFYTQWSGIVDQSATAATHQVMPVFFELFHCFRMKLFFMMAGMFAYLLQERGQCCYLKNRLLRVGIPLVAGVVIALPLIETMKGFGRARTLAPSASIPWKVGIPRFESLEYWSQLAPHYLWFLQYLIIYSLAFLIIHRLVGSIGGNRRLHSAVDTCFARLCRSRLLAVILMFPTLGVQLLTDGALFMNESQTFIPTWTNLLAHSMFFGFGWMLFRHLDRLHDIAKHWQFHYGVGLFVFLLTVGWPELWCPASQAFLAWTFSFSLLGFMVKHASGSSRVLRYLADSSYWLYLAHVPLLMYIQVSWAHWLLPWWLKFPLLNCVLLMILLLSYDLLIRGTWVGFVLNGKRHPTLLGGFVKQKKRDRQKK